MAADDAAVTVSIRAELKDYAAALKSAVRMAERAAKATEDALNAVGKKPSPIAANFNKSAGQIANDARVLQYQLNDIFSGVASGQGIRAVQQQLGQIAQQLGGQGIGSAARTMGAAMIGMINPINLAVVAFGLLATAAAAWFTSSEDEAEAAKKALDEHKKLLNDIKGRWGELLPGVGDYIDEIERASDSLQKMLDRQALLKDAQGDLTKLLEESGSAAVELATLLAQFDKIDLSLQVQEAFTAYQKEIEAGRTGTAELVKLREALAAANRTGIDGVAELVTKLTNDLGPVLRQTEEAVRNITRAFDEMPKSLSGIGPSGQSAPGALGDIMFRKQILSATGAEQLAFLKTKAATQEIADRLDTYGEEAIQAFTELFALLPESARITSAARSYAEQARLYADYKAGRGGLAAPPGRSRHETSTAIDVGQGVSMEELKRAVELTGKLETLKGKAYAIDKVHVQLKGTQKKLDSEAATAAERLAEQQATALVQLEKMLTTEEQAIALAEKKNAINADLSLSEDARALAIVRVTAEAAKEAEVETLLNQAKEAGLAITPALVAQYEALAQAKVNAAIVDKQLAIAQRDATQTAKDQAEAIKQFNQQIAGMAQSAVSGLVNDLRNGVEAGEAFNNMLNRIIDSLIQMALQSLFKPGGGVLGSLFGAAQSGGIVGQTAFPQRNVSPLVFAGAPRFAKGGMVGLRAGEVPIIAHRGEMIIPRHMVGRSGGGGMGGETTINNSPRIRIDMRRDVVTGSTQDAKALGEEVNKAVQIVLVKESRPGGLLRRPQA